MVFVMLSLFAEGCTCEQRGMAREELVSHSEQACTRLNESLDVLLQNIQVEGPEAEASRQAWQEVEAYTAELQRLIQQAQHAGIKVELVVAEHSPLGVTLVIAGTIILVNSLFLSYSYTQALTEALEAEGCQLEPWQKMVIFDIHAGVIATAELIIGKAALRQFMTSVAQYGLMGLPYAAGTAHLTSKVGEILLELMLEHAVDFEKDLILSIIDCLGAAPTQEAAPARSLQIEDFEPSVLPSGVVVEQRLLSLGKDVPVIRWACRGAGADLHYLLYVTYLTPAIVQARPSKADLYVYQLGSPEKAQRIRNLWYTDTPEIIRGEKTWKDGPWYGWVNDKFLVALGPCNTPSNTPKHVLTELMEQIIKQTK